MPDREADSPVTWDNFVAWAGGKNPHGDSRRVTVYGLNTKTFRVVDTVASGEVDWIRGGAHEIVVTELERTPSDADPAVPWKILDIDLVTGKRETIAQSTTPATRQYTPVPELDWPWLVWAESAPARTQLVVHVRNLMTHTGRTVLDQAHVSGVSTTAGWVVFSAPSGGGEDLYAVKADSDAKTPTPISHSHSVGSFTAANGLVGWQEPAHRNPLSLWVAPVDGSAAPRRFVAGETEGNLFPSDRFGAWLNFHGDLVVGTGDGSEVVVAKSSDLTFPHWWVKGRSIVWATGSLDSPIVLHVADVLTTG